MPSLFVSTWIKYVQSKIDYWAATFPIASTVFSITPLPALPVSTPDVLSHDITSCCPTPPFPAISFGHYPEPYYGDADDSVTKSAVVLFYNPGPSSPDQLLGAVGSSTFETRYLYNGCDYYEFSKAFDFCDGTIYRFIVPKNNQIKRLLECFIFNLSEKNAEANKRNNIRFREFSQQVYKPLFMDLIPWHSDNFLGLDAGRYGILASLNQVKALVFIPAILNAKNSLVSEYLNRINKSENKIVLFCIGARYSKDGYLQQLGFDDLTLALPMTNPAVALLDKGEIVSPIQNARRLRIWKMRNDKFFKGFEYDFSYFTNTHLISNTKTELQNKDIYVVNLWVANVGMNIPDMCETLNYVLKQL